MMKIIGFSTKRKMPVLSKKTLKKQFQKLQKTKYKRKVYLFADEFTNYNDADIGIKAIRLLNTLGYEVVIPNISESGRTYLSKGLVRKAKEITEKRKRNCREVRQKLFNDRGISCKRNERAIC